MREKKKYIETVSYSCKHEIAIRSEELYTFWKKKSWTWKHLGLGQTIYFHIIHSFILVTNVLRLCKMSAKEGYGPIHSISLYTGSTCVLLWTHANVYVSLSPSCSLQCGQKEKVLGFLSCRLQSRLLFTQLLHLPRKGRPPLCMPACTIRSQRAEIPAKDVPSSPFHLFSKYPNTSSWVLHARDRS